MNASTIESLLYDLVNHSNHNENLKEKMRSKLNKYEEQKVELKDAKDFRYGTMDEYDRMMDGYDTCDDYADDSESHLINIPKPPTQYNIFLKNTMKKLKLENPNMEAIELMTTAAYKWNDEKIKINQHKIKFLKEIADYKINKDMHKITDLVISNVSGSNFKR